MLLEIFRKIERFYLHSFFSAFLVFFYFFSLTSFFSCNQMEKNSIKTIAIANLGPHATLQSIIHGFKNELSLLGYQLDKTFQIKEYHVNFDQALIPTMLQKIKGDRPSLVLALTTSVSQAAQVSFKDTPVIFAGVTDPIGAKIKVPGVSDLQDARESLKFIQWVVPGVRRIGIPYTPAEVNDLATLIKFNEAGRELGIKIVEVPIEHARDIPIRVRLFKQQVDCIYVTNSNIIQPALPAVISAANTMNVPVFNMSSEAVLNHLAIGSLAVSYEAIGKKAAQIADKVLKGLPKESVSQIYPELRDHQGFISLRALRRFGLKLPKDLKVFRNVIIVPDRGDKSGA